MAEVRARKYNKAPIGISEYKLSESLPADLKGSLASIEELERELGSGGDEN